MMLYQVTKGVMLTSSDGLHWNRTNIGTGTWLDGVACDNGLFVAVGGGTSTVFTSPDGIHWFQQAIGNYAAYGITYGDDGFVVVELNGQALNSMDGTNWISNSIGGGLDTRAVGFGKGFYVTVGDRLNYSNGNLDGVILTSEDGITWILRTTIATDLDYNFSWSCLWCRSIRGCGKYRLCAHFIGWYNLDST